MRINKESSCPKHLLIQKVEEILMALDEKSGIKAITLMENLKNSYAEDESVYQHLASCMLKTLILDRKQRNLELMTYLFNKAEDNFFDTEICVPVLGILLLLKTGTKDKIIEEMFSRMKEMAESDLKITIDSLPDDSFHIKKIKKYRKQLNGRS